MNRRRFLQTAGSVAAAPAFAAGREVSLAVEPGDKIASGATPQWAVGELEAALTARGVSVRRVARVGGSPCIVAAGAGAPAARGVTVAAAPESLVLAPGGPGVTLAVGRDPRGITYALLELADRVRHAADPVAALAVRQRIAEQPANRVRSVARLFTSDVEDKGWYNDRDMWPEYLTLLATQRFNRFHLALGIGHDFLRGVTDAYFLFAYPFLVSPPGHNVRIPQLPDAERDRNLEMLRFISDQAALRGIDFQLGIWTHGYQWIASPRPNYVIEGLSAANHGAYCRDAVRTILKECPAIRGVTMRVHGESGVEEGSYDFWKTVFEGVATCGRKVEIDMHAKGMDQGMIDVALASGMPVKISPKFWAEHLGMTYHQADIRELERPRPGREGTGLMKLSAGSRSFLRYGYGDLLREDRRWGVLHRIWPGTQRMLLWGDPASAAAYSRAFSFCGSDGVDIMEPLSFKGRRGSGIAGGRCAYADVSLRPRWDWQKFKYTYRVWGRLLYNPASDPDVWRRQMRADFGPAAADAEGALASASRILPIVTTSHGASAANNSYWPEVYVNQSMVDAARPGPYGDTPAPRVFGNVSPFDPQLFSRINDFADELLAGERSGRYSPIEAAQWLEDFAADAAKRIAQAETAAPSSVEFRRLAIDVGIQSGLGRFFAAKFRAGVLYRIHEKTGDRRALEECLRTYRAARDVWAEIAGRTRGVYMADITVGEQPFLRGHWADRLPAIDADIAAVAKRLDGAPGSDERAAAAIRQALAHPRPSAPPVRHTPPAQFRPGQPLVIEASLAAAAGTLRLYYRHVTQAERYEVAEMPGRDNRYRAEIPAAYTQSAYPIEYYFEWKGKDAAWLYPGFGADLLRQPYFVVRRSA